MDRMASRNASTPSCGVMMRSGSGGLTADGSDERVGIVEAVAVNFVDLVCSRCAVGVLGSSTNRVREPVCYNSRGHKWHVAGFVRIRTLRDECQNSDPATTKHVTQSRAEYKGVAVCEFCADFVPLGDVRISERMFTQ